MGHGIGVAYGRHSRIHRAARQHRMPDGQIQREARVQGAVFVLEIRCTTSAPRTNNQQYPHPDRQLFCREDHGGGFHLCFTGLAEHTEPQKPRKPSGFRGFVVGMTGFEPATPSCPGPVGHSLPRPPSGPHFSLLNWTFRPNYRDTDGHKNNRSLRAMWDECGMPAAAYPRRSHRLRSPEIALCLQ